MVFTKQKCIDSQFWSLEVGNQGIGGVMFLLKSVGKLIFLSSTDLPEIFGVPWLAIM